MDAIRKERFVCHSDLFRDLFFLQVVLSYRLRVGSPFCFVNVRVDYAMRVFPPFTMRRHFHIPRAGHLCHVNEQGEALVRPAQRDAVHDAVVHLKSLTLFHRYFAPVRRGGRALLRALGARVLLKPDAARHNDGHVHAVRALGIRALVNVRANARVGRHAVQLHAPDVARKV
eukprot:6202790-Pleurochrysis_carterae.AAC.1